MARRGPSQIFIRLPKEAAISRFLYGGIHFRSAIDVGVVQEFASALGISEALSSITKVWVHPRHHGSVHSSSFRRSGRPTRPDYGPNNCPEVIELTLADLDPASPLNRNLTG